MHITPWLACAVVALPQVPRSAEVHPEQLFLKARPGLGASEREDALRQAGARQVLELPQIGWEIVRVPQGRMALAKAILQASGQFARVEHDHAMRLAHVPNDPYWYGMWHMTKIRADVAWDSERGDPLVKVAVIDTGLETNHPDLAANVWTNPGEIAGNNFDDDFNGYIDDVHGYDFAYLDPNPDDVFGHGTACAGIIAAVQDNLQGVTGVAPNCQIAGLKAAIDSGYLYDSAVVPALLYAADMGFDVASMSFFGDQVTSAQKDAIEYCYAQGLLPVASAGNSNQTYPYYPAAFAETLSVGASEYSDLKSWFSNYGSWVDVVAPGEGLWTTLPGAGYTSSFAGTSGSCPHVAGLAALLFSASPSATPASVRAAIEDGSQLLNQPPYGHWSLYGRIDSENALQRVLGNQSGSVAPRLTYVAPCGGNLRLSAAGASTSPPPRVYWQGVGLEAPSVVEVWRDSTALAVLLQSRQEIHTRATNLPGPLSFRVGGNTLATLHWELADGWLYAPSDANTQGGGSPLLQGGFFELYRADGNFMTCTRRDDGLIYVALCLREVRPVDPLFFEGSLTRSYVDSIGASEVVQLYRWSTASYPYGSFETVNSKLISSGASLSTQFSTLSGNPSEYIDINGTVYVQILTSGVGPAGKLFLDEFRLRLR